MGCGNCANARWMMFVNRVQTAAEQSTDKVMQVAAEKGLLKAHHTGGYFRLKMIGAGASLIPPMLIRELPEELKESRIAYCNEKGDRLEVEYKKDPEHVRSSWQSRDPDNDKWGGAVIGIDYDGRAYTYSFSGLPEICDEVINLMIAVEVGHLTADEAGEIAEISGSDDLLEACGCFDDGIVTIPEGER